MKLADIIAQVSRAHVVQLALEGPYQEYGLGLIEVFDGLGGVQPAPSDMMLVVRRVADERDGEVYHEVYGINQAVPGDEAHYGLGFMAWAKWLGSPVCRETLDSYLAAEIVLHCLYDMTFYGFTEEDIAGEHGQVRQTIQEVEAGDMRTISLEELLADLAAGADEGTEDAGPVFDAFAEYGLVPS